MKRWQIVKSLIQDVKFKLSSGTSVRISIKNKMIEYNNNKVFPEHCTFLVQQLQDNIATEQNP
jgi:hypothetical protein